MPHKAKRPCKEKGCNGFALDKKSYCQDHERAFKRSLNLRRTTDNTVYQSARWKKLRVWFLRQNPLCIECKKHNIDTPATEVDHIEPHKGDMELFYKADNLQGLCKPCHSRKTMREINNA